MRTPFFVYGAVLHAHARELTHTLSPSIVPIAMQTDQQIPRKQIAVPHTGVQYVDGKGEPKEYTTTVPYTFTYVHVRLFLCGLGTKCIRVCQVALSPLP